MSSINNRFSKLIILAAMVLYVLPLSAREIIGGKPSANKNNLSAENLMKTAAGCSPPTAKVDLDVNNVRTMILNGGDMWWDLSSAKYEIPKVTDPNGIRRHSLFAGSLWIGGLDNSGNLKIAAMTYRQGASYDFWPGPLNTVSASILSERCTYYDKIWKITAPEIFQYREDYDAGLNPTIPSSIDEWPGNGDPGYGEEFNLAPYDNRGSLRYNPSEGDVPKILGDMALWWVYNDKGNIHTETNGLPIGLECRTMAFAYSTNDEINNMTFYQTEVINRGTDRVDSCYFGQWVDADLGNYTDDYVGCDVPRALGICYNGDDDDEGILGYGLNPPSIGVDFFKGPKDPNGNLMGMAKFVYYDNNFNNINGNPQATQHYYNYLRGIWKNNQRMTYGGNGVGGADTASYMFPGTTDPGGRTNWTEFTAGNTPADRRFLQSAGPFTLLPGARNEVTIGVVWARASSGGATGSLELLKQADDKAQKLFNNNFQIVDGPSSPDAYIQELDQELIINIASASPTSNFSTTKVENYSDTVKGAAGNDIIYKFQGYQIFQLKDATVTTGELANADRARLIAQVDIKDNVTQLVNKVFDPTINDFVKVEKVNGKNEGLSHSFRISTDAFAKGNSSLVNFKSYHFVILSYAYATNDPTDPDQYLAGRLNNKIYSVSPHKPDPTNGGVDASTLAKYGDGPKIKRLEGRGNGGNVLELSEETVNEILANRFAPNPVYKGGFGPVKVKVVDPLAVPDANFELILDGNTATNTLLGQDTMVPGSKWRLINITSGDTVYSDTTIRIGNEQIIRKWGLSVSVRQVNQPGRYYFDINDQANGFIEASIIWADNSKQWLGALQDDDGITTRFTNWIRSGSIGQNDGFGDGYQHDMGEDLDGDADVEALDPREVYEKALDRKFAPYRLVATKAYNAGPPAKNTFGMGWDGTDSYVKRDARLENLSSIDLVLTSDKTKWTRACVVELAENANDAIGAAAKMSLRNQRSVDIDGNPVSDPNDIGRGWFPGYAINLETGQRLNIMFGEDSRLASENGTDLIWNPTSNVNRFTDPYPLVGGKHYIYIMGADFVRTPSPGVSGTAYDEGVNIQTLLKSGSNTDKRRVYAHAMYVMPAYLESGFTLKSLKDGIVPSDVTVRFRVTKPYAKFATGYSGPNLNGDKPHYSFSTSDIAAKYSEAAGKKSVELINIVPNPYYGYAPSKDYEGDQVSTNVKITNLPPKCTIKIYTLNGNLVRTIKKDDDRTDSKWDLNNNFNVPIASGMYIIHVDCGNLGEKILKFFCVMRPVDLDSF